MKLCRPDRREEKGLSLRGEELSIRSYNCMRIRNGEIVDNYFTLTPASLGFSWSKRIGKEHSFWSIALSVFEDE